MRKNIHRRIVFAHEGGGHLPITLDSMGHNPEQEKVTRPEGYETYHWLQTSEGEGIIHFDNKSHLLPQGSGVLLLPFTPHRYESTADNWSTLYLTFGGNSAASIIETLGMNTNSLYRWENKAPLTHLLNDMLDSHDASQDMFGLGGSTDAYRFLLTLSKYGQFHNNTTISLHVDKLQPLLKWMDSHYGDPDLGLSDLAEQLGVSERYLNKLFLQTFGLSPYAYFVRLRIRKSKEMLVTKPNLTVKNISQRVGFRDVSHYVATFRKQSGTTPEQFRKLH